MSFNFRFSLLALLLVITLVCIGVALWRARVDVQRIEARIQQQKPVLRGLHDQLGVLTIGDPQAVHVIAHSKMHYYQVGLDQPWDLRWRLQLPEPSRWQMCWAFEGLPASGLPAKRAGSMLLATDADSRCEVLLSFSRGATGEWIAALRHRNIRGSYRIPQREAGWLTKGEGLGWECAGAEGVHHWTTEEFPPDQPAILLRCIPDSSGAVRVLNQSKPGRVTFGVGRSASTLAPNVGVMVWIEPIPLEAQP